MLLDKLQQFTSEDLMQRQTMKSSLAEFILSSGETLVAMNWITNHITNLHHDKKDTSFFTSVDNPELITDLLEVAHRSLTSVVDLQPYVIPVAQLLFINKQARDKSESERYVQYRAAAMLDELISLNVSLPPEAIQLMLSKYFINDISTQELNSSIWWRLAERGINISCHINTLHVYLKNHESTLLTNNSILSLWACIREGYFDTPIPNSSGTYQSWLWQLATSCVSKMKKKYEVSTRLLAVGCLLETAIRYTETQYLILDCMNKWGIEEPKSPRGDFQRDLKELFDRCRNYPDTNCLPQGYVITKNGITISRSKATSVQ